VSSATPRAATYRGTTGVAGISSGWRIAMKKTKYQLKPRTLEFKKEIVATLGTAALENVVGGDNSTRKSQCPTLCFT